MLNTKINSKVVIFMVVIGFVLSLGSVVGYLVERKSDSAASNLKSAAPAQVVAKPKYTPNDLTGFELNFQNLYCDAMQLAFNFWEDMNSTKYNSYIDSNNNDVPKMRVIGKKYQTMRESLNIDAGLTNLANSVLKDEFPESLRLLQQSWRHLNEWIDGNANLASFDEFKNEVSPTLESYSISMEFTAGAYKREIGYLFFDYPELETKMTTGFTDLEDLCTSMIALMEANKEKEASITQLYEYPGNPIKYDVKNFDENVKRIQERLVYFGYKVTIDGYFGNETKNAVIAFQKRNSFETDGIVGPITWEALFQDKEAESAFINIPNYDTMNRASNNAYYIYGTTSDNCVRVTVLASNPSTGIKDTYQLKEYKPGDTSFKYGIREDWNNLSEGDNTYKFTAYCEGNQVKSASTTLTYTVTKPTYYYPTTTTLPTNNCDPNYSGCVPIASDVDCAGGGGNGPAYVYGSVRVIGSDIYDLDRDNDGYGCE